MADKRESRPMGRPLKGKDRRMQIGVYVAGSVIDAMDNYVANRQEKKRGYSRSDFINEAIEMYMGELGLLEGEEADAERQE